jgi:hypothetical protein
VGRNRYVHRKHRDSLRSTACKLVLSTKASWAQHITQTLGKRDALNKEPNKKANGQQEGYRSQLSGRKERFTGEGRSTPLLTFLSRSWATLLQKNTLKNQKIDSGSSY